MSAKPSELTSPGSATDSPFSVKGRVTVALRGFGPLGIIAILAILGGNFLVVPLSAILVLVWTRLSRTPWHQIGYVRPKNWVGSLVVGLAFGISLKLLMKAVVMPVLGAPPINAAYHYLAGNTVALPEILYVAIVGAGFGEETVFRGWMFERLGKLFGISLLARIFVVLITSVYHVATITQRRQGGSLFSENAHDHAPPMRGAPVLKHEDALPRAELKPSLGDRNYLARPRQNPHCTGLTP